ncbi:hypothetical protein L1987_34784 [Smallanthus sonchifolius]|uniref:Uncharacterized protein n=1 Tax=Smallanthus sonchifolius TaxID=185202 RepID=A0ACB9HW09_9ASTR|nr:hypothetical protein L1987_34784 [Smallanthus sonchifolius]
MYTLSTNFRPKKIFLSKRQLRVLTIHARLIRSESICTAPFSPLDLVTSPSTSSEPCPRTQLKSIVSLPEPKLRPRYIQVGPDEIFLCSPPIYPGFTGINSRKPFVQGRRFCI